MATAVAGMVAVILFLLINVAGYCWLLKLTTEVVEKLSPLRVKVKSGLPATINEGLIDVKEGAGFETANANGVALPPPGAGLITLTG